MRGLTVHYPWSWAIAHAGKWVENRDWPPPEKYLYERIAIHAGVQVQRHVVEQVFPYVPRLPLDVKDMHKGEPFFVVGAIVAAPVLRGWARLVPVGDGTTAIQSRGVTELEAAAAVDSQWYQGPPGYAWIFGDNIALPVPVACRGRQRLWTVPSNVEQRVREQVAHVMRWRAA